MTGEPIGNTTFETPYVRCTRRSDGVAVVTLDRPRANALSRGVLRALTDLTAHLHADLPTAVVVWGGPRIFAAGGDINEMGGPEEARQLVDLFRSAYDGFARLPRLVIAAVNGYALGGGCELALAADFRVAGRSARFGLPEILLGLIPAAGGTQRLARLIGPARAKDMLVSGRQVDGEEALRIGLVDRLVDDEAVLDEAIDWATQIGRGALVAQGRAKQLVDLTFDVDLADGLDAEGEAAIALHHTEDARVGVRSFLENGPGKAVFSGR